jgi:serine/threonine protein kinase
VKIDCIGKGGSSKVFKVIAQDMNIYAVKKVSLSDADSETIGQYLNEINHLKRLRNHKNIIHLVDSEIDKHEGCLYIVLEFGEIDLAKLIQQQGERFDHNYLRLVWQQMLEAVHTVHQESIVHTDLKPANFVIVKGSLKLIDFGIARSIQNDTTNVMLAAQVCD